MNSELNSIWLDWRAKVPNGVPNPSNDYHLVLLKELCHKRGIDKDIVDNVILTLEKKGETNKKDIPLLRNLGALDSVSDEDLEDILNDKVALSGVTCGRGSGTTAFQDISKYGLSELEKILKDGDKFYITYAGNEKKFRNEFNIRICKWNNSKKKGDVNYRRIALMYKLYKKNKSKIEVKERNAAGIGFEDMQIAELNDYFETLSTEPIQLYVDGTPMGVKVNGSTTVTGNPKADFTLDNKGTPVFWVSYKHGEYYKGTAGDINAKVPFQQYGSMSSFFDKSFEQKAGVKGLGGVSNVFLKGVIKKLKKDSYKGVTAMKNLGKGEVELTMGKKTKVIKDTHGIFAAHSVKFYETNVWKAGHKKIDLYLVPSKIGFYKGFEKDPKYADIAGATIYGTEFKKGNTNFSKENVNILLQAKEKLTLDPMSDEEGSIQGVNLNTRQAGHITYNPNVPTNDPKLSQYLPVFVLRHTKAQHFGFKEGSTTNLIMGGRYLIMPKGNATGTEL
jgi:hypothetical protein